MSLCTRDTPRRLAVGGSNGSAFALNSSVHSYLVLAYSESDRVSLSVGFYYMANACGRLLGTLLSGVLYQFAGVSASLWGAWSSLRRQGSERCCCRQLRARSTGAEQKGTSKLRDVATAGAGGSQAKV